MQTMQLKHNHNLAHDLMIDMFVISYKSMSFLIENALQILNRIKTCVFF